MRCCASGQLVGMKGLAPGPVKGKRGEDGSQGVISVAGHAAFRAEGHDHLRAEFADMLRQFPHYFVEVLPVKLAIGVVQNHRIRDFENLARSGEFLAPHRHQFLVITRAAAMRGCLSGREANHGRLHAAIAVKQQ